MGYVSKRNKKHDFETSFFIFQIFETFGSLRINFSIKANESQYKWCGLTPHFPKTKNSFRNFGDAECAITIDNDSSIDWVVDTDCHGEKLERILWRTNAINNVKIHKDT